ncbi:MAG: glycosyltransferase [Anaeromyxobacter sp.]
MPTALFIANAAVIHTVRWVNAIAQRGWSVHVLTLTPPREPLHEAVTVHLAPWGPPAGYFLDVPFAKRVIRDVRPDLVHAHYAAGYGTLAALAAGHPLITSVWGSDIYAAPEKSPLHRRLIRWNLARSDLVLSTSHAMAERTRRHTAREIGITPFGIDTEQFSPRPGASPFQPTDVVVGTVKTLDSIYGIDVLIRAFGLLKERLPGCPLKLLLVGEGPQEAALRRLARELGVDGDTVFAGRVEHRRVPEYQNMLSVSVSVSTGEESFGVAVLEASACGKPVVVSSVGGLPEVVVDGATGIVVPPRDPVRTADAIERLVRDPELRRRMGEAGRRRVLELYDWERSVDIMLGFYARVLAQRGA